MGQMKQLQAHMCTHRSLPTGYIRHREGLSGIVLARTNGPVVVARLVVGPAVAAGRERLVAARNAMRNAGYQLEYRFL